MRKILAPLLASAAIGGVGWAECCPTIYFGPTAWTPTFSKANCGVDEARASYGGTVTMNTDENGQYGVFTGTRADLVRTNDAGDTVVASKESGANCQCGHQTVLAILTTTATCRAMTGSNYFTKFSVTYMQLCAMQNMVTVSRSGEVVRCP